MATQAARAARNRDVRNRMDVALLRISKSLDIPIPPQPKRAKDSGLQPIVELERSMLFMESVADSLAGLAQQDEAPAGYESWSMQMLRDELKNRNIDKPARTKAEAVSLLKEDDAIIDQLEAEELEPESENGNGEPEKNAGDDAPENPNTTEEKADEFGNDEDEFDFDDPEADEEETERNIT